mgnify:FL=1
MSLGSTGFGVVLSTGTLFTHQLTAQYAIKKIKPLKYIWLYINHCGWRCAWLNCRYKNMDHKVNSAQETNHQKAVCC